MSTIIIGVWCVHVCMSESVCVCERMCVYVCVRANVCLRACERVHVCVVSMCACMHL